MKKFLLICLLLILPFQFSWAMASTYCQHETGKAAHHFGHHLHQHQAQADGANAADAKTKGSSAKKTDADCGFCHLTVPAPLASHVSHWIAAPGKTFAVPFPVLYSSHIPDGPHRPDRRVVA